MRTGGVVTALIGAIASVAVAWITATSTANTAATGKVNEYREEGAFRTLEEGQKLCSVAWPDHWRDSFVVPKTWTADVCKSWGAKTGGNQYQLGCVFRTSSSLGPVNGGAPDQNCGW